MKTGYFPTQAFQGAFRGQLRSQSLLFDAASSDALHFPESDQYLLAKLGQFAVWRHVEHGDGLPDLSSYMILWCIQMGTLIYQPIFHTGRTSHGSRRSHRIHGSPIQESTTQSSHHIGSATTRGLNQDRDCPTSRYRAYNS